MTYAFKFLPVSLVLLFLAGCSRQQKSEVQAASKGPDPIAVRVAPAEQRQVPRTLAVVGSLQPDETVSVSFEVAGRISKISADFGQHVRQGQVLAELDRHEYEIQLERSKAALAQSLARVGLNPGQEDTTPKETPAIRQARAQYEDARSKFENAAKLVQSGDISRERHTELEKQMIARRAALDSAEDDLRTQLANIQAIRAEKKLVEKRLNDTVVRAPFDGAVTERKLSPGQYLKENTPILTLVKTNPLRLRLAVPEAGAGAIQVGDTLTFTTDALHGKEFTAVVRELNPSLEAQSRSLVAEARIQKGDPALRPGMFVQVRVVIEKNANITVVPKDAVYTMAGLTKVFTVSGGKAREHRITPGMTQDGWVEVPGAQILPGELVALNNVQNLTDGAEVRQQ
jgi:RND family efflux transporter MFP subunit